jgi:glucosylceramidase
VTYQELLGFGGAFTDSASYVFSSLTSTLQKRVLDMYFSEDGIGYSLARLPIGSCDFSLGNYNYDKTKGDKDLTNFSIAHDKKNIIPFIQQAIATRKEWSKDGIKIIASPWSPPAWMKEIDDPYCPLGCIVCNLRKEYHDTWSMYFSKFITAYAGEGIPMWGITVQNEPGACPLDYEGMHWTPDTERDYLKGSLGPILSKEHPEIKILVYDHNKDKTVKWAQTIFSDADAAKYAWGIAVHWYTGDHFDQLNTTHHLFPQKFILATEATEVREKTPETPKWEKGEHYAHDILGDLNNWSVGFIDWNLILDYYGAPNHAGPGECQGIIKCGSDAMLLADLDKQILYPQVFYWYVGHISKFIPPGSVRVNVTVSTGNQLECTAFVTPDKNVVLVVLNRQDTDISVKIADVLPTSRTIQALKFTALAHSIQTLIYT